MPRMVLRWRRFGDDDVSEAAQGTHRHDGVSLIYAIIDAPPVSTRVDAPMKTDADVITPLHEITSYFRG